MTAPNLLDELAGVVWLSEKATPGKVELHTSCSWRRIVAERGRPFLVPTIDPDRHQNMDTTESAEFVVALVNWFRANHATIANMAAELSDYKNANLHAADDCVAKDAEIARLTKRLEAAERAAARYRWLRDECDTTTGFLLGQRIEADEWDAAIDAAMQEGEG